MTEESGISEQWLVNELRTNPEFREELRDNTELGSEVLTTVIREKYKKQRNTIRDTKINEKDKTVDTKINETK